MYYCILQLILKTIRANFAKTAWTGAYILETC